jgi:hypothetical protein
MDGRDATRSGWTPRLRAAATFALAIGLGGPAGAAAQPPQGTPQGTARAATAKELAAVDLTGTYVSIVTEDWLYRMVTPAKGDYFRVPLTAEGRRVADAWDPGADEAAGAECKAYSAPAIMRVPGRIRMSWQDANTLKIETDAGQQTRLLHFGEGERPAPGTEAGYQGYSVAAWEYAGGFIPNAAPRVDRGPGGNPVPAGGSLKVVTTNLKAGYLRKNGVPYSKDAELTEYFDRYAEANGDEWLTVTAVVHDPLYMNEEFTTSSHFKREAADGQPDPKWRPTPCTAR